MRSTARNPDPPARIRRRPQVSEILSPIEPRIRPDAASPGLRFDPSSIRDNRLLAALPSADFALLAPHFSEVHFSLGAVIQEPGQPIIDSYFLQCGLVSLLFLLPDGRAVGTCAIGQEGAIGLTELVGRTASTRAVVHAPVCAAAISAVHLAEAAEQSKAIRDMVGRYSEDLRQQTLKVLACNTVHDLTQRVCRWLLQARHRTGDDTLWVTQERLAEELGVQRTTITMIQHTLQAEEIIKVRRGRIHIHDLGALENRSCTCHRNGQGRSAPLDDT
jgi:CRP-like cAMP-binding protein